MPNKKICTNFGKCALANSHEDFSNEKRSMTYCPLCDKKLSVVVAPSRDLAAKIVIDERSGIIVMGRDVRVATVGALDVFLKPLEDGSSALALFNRSSAPEDFLFNKLPSLGLGGRQHVRNLWKHADLADCTDELTGTVAGHGVLLLKLTKVPKR